MIFLNIFDRMIFSVRVRSNLFRMFALVLFLTAVYHFVAVFYIMNDLPAWRHLLFVGIDLFCVYGALYRPTYFLYFVGALVIQQFYTHGNLLATLWFEKNQIHWISFLDLFLCILALICLIEDRKMKLRNKSNF